MHTLNIGLHVNSSSVSGFLMCARSPSCGRCAA